MSGNNAVVEPPPGTDFNGLTLSAINKQTGPLPGPTIVTSGVSGNNRAVRRAGLVDAGLADCLLFGSDTPLEIGPNIAVVEAVPFLTASQKRDIFYNNAARFLRLAPEEIGGASPLIAGPTSPADLGRLRGTSTARQALALGPFPALVTKHRGTREFTRDSLRT